MILGKEKWWVGIFFLIKLEITQKFPAYQTKNPNKFRNLKTWKAAIIQESHLQLSAEI